MLTKTSIVFIIWFIINLITTIGNAEKIKWYGSVDEAAKHGSILDLFYISSIILMLYLSYLLIDSGYWWVPIGLQQFVVSPIIRTIYDI